MKRLALFFFVVVCVVRACADGVETRKSWVEFAERLATPILPLGLPPTDSFWTCPDADWTAKKAWSGEPFLKDGRSNFNPQTLYWE